MDPNQETQSPADPGQRRAADRYDCAGMAEVRPRPVAPPSRGKILDLSLGGCYIEADFAFEVGRRVEIVIQVCGMSLRAVGQIVYTQLLRDPGRPRTTFQYVGMGIRFVGMSKGGRLRLQELIDEFQHFKARQHASP